MNIPIITKWLLGHIVAKNKYQVISVDDFKILLSDVGINLTHKQQNRLSKKMFEMSTYKIKNKR